MLSVQSVQVQHYTTLVCKGCFYRSKVDMQCLLHIELLIPIMAEVKNFLVSCRTDIFWYQIYYPVMSTSVLFQAWQPATKCDVVSVICTRSWWMQCGLRLSGSQMERLNLNGWDLQPCFQSDYDDVLSHTLLNKLFLPDPRVLAAVHGEWLQEPPWRKRMLESTGGTRHKKAWFSRHWSLFPFSKLDGDLSHYSRYWSAWCVIQEHGCVRTGYRTGNLADMAHFFFLWQLKVQKNSLEPRDDCFTKIDVF